MRNEVNYRLSPELIKRWVDIAVERWLKSQIMDLTVDYYLFYNENYGLSIQTEECGSKWILASKYRLSPLWSKEQAQLFCFDAAMRLPVFKSALDNQKSYFSNRVKQSVLESLFGGLREQESVHNYVEILLGKHCDPINFHLDYSRNQFGQIHIMKDSDAILAVG